MVMASGCSHYVIVANISDERVLIAHNGLSSSRRRLSPISNEWDLNVRWLTDLRLISDFGQWFEEWFIRAKKTIHLTLRWWFSAASSSRNRPIARTRLLAGQNSSDINNRDTFDKSRSGAGSYDWLIRSQESGCAISMHTTTNQSSDWRRQLSSLLIQILLLSMLAPSNFESTY